MTGSNRILVVDDDPLFCEMTRRVLETHGFYVDTAFSSEEGMAKMAQEPPDLVILDVMMSWVLDGVFVSREMMGSPRLQGIPIILCTSIRNSEYAQFFPQDEYLHIDSWLDKPCPPAQLVAAVEATLARRRQLSAPNP